jgi:hypothetical protein
MALDAVSVCTELGDYWQLIFFFFGIIDTALYIRIKQSKTYNSQTTTFLRIMHHASRPRIQASIPPTAPPSHLPFVPSNTTHDLHKLPCTNQPHEHHPISIAQMHADLRRLPSHLAHSPEAKIR